MLGCVLSLSLRVVVLVYEVTLISTALIKTE